MKIFVIRMHNIEVNHIEVFASTDPYSAIMRYNDCIRSACEIIYEETQTNGSPEYKRNKVNIADGLKDLDDGFELYWSDDFKFEIQCYIVDDDVKVDW